IVCMKHVGLNVAADAFINAAITGINGGLVVLVADDPSMHSSQNEQDSRFYGKFAMIPILEPHDQQEAYDMAYHAFELSEKYKTPVLMRIPTRLAHSRAGVNRKTIINENPLRLPADLKQFILLPAIAKIRYKKLLAAQTSFNEESENSAFNQYFDGADKSLGIIACGIAYNYYMENAHHFHLNHPVLKIGQYPLPQKLIRQIVKSCKRILVLEDGYPFVEDQLNNFLTDDLNISGRLDGSLPRDGELTPDIVGKALGIEAREIIPVPELVMPRPPSFCKGCSHADTYLQLNEALKDYEKGRVFSDIGCYTLGALEPYNAINSCVDMGASITMAKGAADAGLSPVVAVIGDSTFTHSGMTGLLDIVLEQTPVTVIISDNSTTGMTGGQKSSATGRLESICRGLGVDPDHIKVITPLHSHFEENVEIIKKEVSYPAPSVIISQRECIQTAARRKRKMRQ
ncbi:MAG: thiamine pyrophosphate-dependent enzyme, partial [Bacteroidota bacterium]|nr:thiamine pyrophosphate-dependent enzyme [Bacteroidota bacterium]